MLRITVWYLGGIALCLFCGVKFFRSENRWCVAAAVFGSL